MCSYTVPHVHCKCRSNAMHLPGTSVALLHHIHFKETTCIATIYILQSYIQQLYHENISDTEPQHPKYIHLKTAQQKRSRYPSNHTHASNGTVLRLEVPQLPLGGAVLAELKLTSGPGLGNCTSAPSSVEHPLPTFAANKLGRLPNGSEGLRSSIPASSPSRGDDRGWIVT